MNLPFVDRFVVTLKTPISAIFLLGSLSLGLVPVAKAQITLSFVYDPLTTTTTASYSGTMGIGYNVLGTGSGMTAYPLDTHIIDGVQLLNITGSHAAAPSAPSTFYTLPWVTFNREASSSSYSGDEFGIMENGTVYGPTYFTAATVVSGFMTFEALSLGDLGLTSGDSGSIVFGNGFVANWSATTAVPEPSTYAVLVGLIALLGTIAVRKRLKQV